jgi:hypothetical protein
MRVAEMQVQPCIVDTAFERPNELVTAFDVLYSAATKSPNVA